MGRGGWQVSWGQANRQEWYSSRTVILKVTGVSGSHTPHIKG